MKRRPRGKRRAHEKRGAPPTPKPRAAPQSGKANHRRARAALERATRGTPNDFQLRAWDAIAAAKDTQLVAPTGTGKTFAAVLPILELRDAWPEPHAALATRVLYLVPTRELAKQVGQACAPMTELHGLQLAVAVGGEPREAQRAAMSQSEMLIGTPGRLLDLLRLEPGPGPTPSPSLASVRYVVVDEADKMLQMGLRAQVETILGATPAGRQLVFATATASDPAYGALSEEWLRAPVCVGVSRSELRGLSAAVAPPVDAGASPEASTAANEEPLPEVPSTIKQEVTVVAEHKKPRRLLRLLASLQAEAANGGDRRILIFANRIKTVDFVMDMLLRHRVSALALSSQLSSHERQAALSNLQSGRVQIIVATDVAARGIDIPGLETVINWDAGTNLTQYAHRVGRTGRQGATGSAYTFFSRNLKPLAPAMVRLLRASGQKVETYLQTLAREAEGEGPAPLEQALEPRDVEARAEPAEGAVSGEEGERALDEGAADSESGDGGDDEYSAQTWLLGRLVSPITGQAAAFRPGGNGLLGGATAKGVLATRPKKRLKKSQAL